MRSLRNVPIKRKLVIITMITSTVAIMITCLSFVGYDILNLRKAIVGDLATTATIVAENSTAALSFNDPGSALQTLSSLTTRPHIVGAVIYDKEGEIFAKYQRPALPGGFTAPAAQADGDRSEDGFLKMYHGIYLGGERVGTIYLQLDLQEVRDRVNSYAVILVLVMVVAFGTSYLLSKILQNGISAPISNLAAVVQIVAVDKNYSVRAAKTGDDELGDLIEGFNEMLNQIQQRDYALQTAHSELEQRVQERTKELANSLSLLNAIIESSSDGIVAHQFTDKSLYYNAGYQMMWAMPKELLESQYQQTERMVWIAEQTTNSTAFVQRLSDLRNRSETEAFDVIELKDGRIIERLIRPQRINGENTGVVISYRDITERKRAERELEQVNQQLLETSRQAGMAEVATGVLHNVGNVLNSVNVSANLVAERTKSSKVSGLSKVAILLREHQHELGEFLRDDPKGKHLPIYLNQLCDHLLVEQQTTIKELEHLRYNIDHIKQIVSMQQTYSKVSGVKEIVNVSTLIEDTLRMNSGALQRHGVNVICDFAAVPSINTDKHKILQILVNLVRNAKFACSESGRPDKNITVRVSSDTAHINISVADDGIGIAPENLTRVFSHGFTTRKDGHGFGLHSGALAARELGGSLRAYSDGIGHGATFTLELPIALQEPAYA